MLNSIKSVDLLFTIVIPGCQMSIEIITWIFVLAVIFYNQLTVL